MLFKSPHRQKKRYLKRIYIFGVLAIIAGVAYLHYVSYINSKRRSTLMLGRLNSYNETVKDDGTFKDTYLRKLQQFLKKANLSIVSYEQTVDVDSKLQTMIEEEIDHLRHLQDQQLSNIRHDEERYRGCRQSCCWSQKRMIDFYNGEKHRFPTALDRLSQIDFKLLADLHYGSLPVPDGIHLSKLTYGILPCLQNNTVIFVDTTDLQRFFRDFHEKILVNYILITGDSDFSCPYHIIRTHSQLLDQIFSGKTHIRHWFAMNCHLGNNEQWKQSTMFTCIPQGISQSHDYRYYMQLVSGKDDSVHNTHLKTDDYWIFTSFNRNNGIFRQELWDLSCHGRLKNISKCFYELNAIEQWRYYLHIARSRFVLSPPGDGVDCYRTWEALYLGSIPIILNTKINSIFQQLPVLIVNSYEEITLQLLNDVYDNMTRHNHDYKRLYKGYWQKKINSCRYSNETIQIEYTSH